jgi:hypothetical protein
VEISTSDRASNDLGSTDRWSDALQRLVAQLDIEPCLLESNQLRQRLEALDALDEFDRLDARFPHNPAVFADASVAELYDRARAIYTRLEAVNRQLYQTIRHEIQREAQPGRLLRWAHSLPEVEDGVANARGMGYDYLDELVSGVLSLEEPSEADVHREPEMVFYQPTPARHIFRLIQLAALTETDVLVDLGSGLGHVPLLVSICTRARSIGIELETAYVERAQQCAQALNLNRVSFIQQDARAADLSSGTVFYLYTPFTGSILSYTLNRLRCEAATRPIRICSYGPCTPVIAEEPWLETTATPETDRVAIFSSRD